MRAFQIEVENGAGKVGTIERAHSTASAVTRALIDCYQRGLDREDPVTITVKPLPIGEEE